MQSYPAGSYLRPDFYMRPGFYEYEYTYLLRLLTTCTSNGEVNEGAFDRHGHKITFVTLL